MTVNDIKKLLNADILCGEEFADREVHTACGSDMMSDVLAFVRISLFFLQVFVILRLFVQLK